MKTVYYGLQSVKRLVPKIWETLPNNVKFCDYLSQVKKFIKS